MRHRFFSWLRRFLPSLRRLIIATLFVVTLNLFLVVQQLPPLHVIQRHAKERHEQADSALRQFFGLSPSRLACVVPEFPLFNDDFNRIYGNDVELFKHDGSVKCASPLLTGAIKVELDFDDATSTLRLLNATLPIDRCSVRCVIRDSDNEISFSTDYPILTVGPPGWDGSQTKLSCEFFRLSCYGGKTSAPLFTDLYSTITLLSERKKSKIREMIKKRQSASKQTDNRPFNVFMFGMDGVSRQNFHRLMNGTRGFFERTSDLIDFKIYNKVRDNTFVNIVPMTTGHFADDLPWNESIASWKSFDDFNFIWKDFSKKLGYKTVYAEDFPEISIFNYLKFGFKNSPTDFYFRPMNLAMSADRDAFHGHESLCFKNRFEVDYVFDYVRSALLQAQLASNPYFAFVYLTRITHEDQALAVVADRLYAKFFEQLANDKLMDEDRTIIVLFSDHGTRWGSYRTTIYGKYEERLPAFSIALPKSFRTEFPTEFANLEENSRKLVTPFDVYHTLKDILRLSQLEVSSRPVDDDGSKRQGANKRGSSLFGKIPWARSCEKVGVEQHWCACHESTELDASSKNSVKLGLAVVTHLNANIIAPFYRLCSNWTLSSLLEIRLLKPNDKFLLFKNSINDVNDRTVLFDRSALERTKTRLAFYQVTVLVHPHSLAKSFHSAKIEEQMFTGAVFEATIHARMSVDGSTSDLRVEGISRLNAYGGQSECVDVHSIKPFCYCNNGRS